MKYDFKIKSGVTFMVLILKLTLGHIGLPKLYKTVHDNRFLPENICLYFLIDFCECEYHYNYSSRVLR